MARYTRVPQPFIYTYRYILSTNATPRRVRALSMILYIYTAGCAGAHTRYEIRCVEATYIHTHTLNRRNAPRNSIVICNCDEYCCWTRSSRSLRDNEEPHICALNYTKDERAINFQCPRACSRAQYAGESDIEIHCAGVYPLLLL